MSDVIDRLAASLDRERELERKVNELEKRLLAKESETLNLGQEIRHLQYMQSKTEKKPEETVQVEKKILQE